MTRVMDNHPALGKKDVVLAKSGVYWYSYDDMVARGYTPKIKKDRYSEYRPAEVLRRNKDKFGLITMSVEHTDDETTTDNFDAPGQVSGVVGNAIREERLQDGELGLIAEAAFFKRDIMDYMSKGNKETSADYKSYVVEDPSGKYDYILKDIVSVNNVVVTEAGRGGELVRVRDSVRQLKKNNGGSDMDILKWLGFTRSTDTAKVKLSKVVFDSIEAVNKVDRTKDSKGYLEVVEVEGKKVAEVVTRLQDGAFKDGITSIIKAGFQEPEKLLATKDKTSKVLDTLYESARVKDAEDLKKTMDNMEMESEDGLSPEEKAKKEAEAKEKEKKDKESETKDVAAQVKDSVDAMRKEIIGTLPSLITSGIAAALKIDPATIGGKGRTTDSKDDLQKQVDAELAKLLGGKPGNSSDERVLDSEFDSDIDTDASFLLDHNF